MPPRSSAQRDSSPPSLNGSHARIQKSFAAPPTRGWRATSMLVAVDHDAHEENAGEQASLEALFERRRRRSFLTRIALRRVPPHEGSSDTSPHERRIKPEPNRFSPKPAKGRRRSSFTFTGVGGLLGQVAAADSATIAAAET